MQEVYDLASRVGVHFVLPLEPLVLAASPSQLLKKCGSPSTVTMAYSGLAWLHDIICRNVVKAAKCNGVQRKNKITDMVNDK